MALFIKPSSFFLNFFALTLVFQVSASAQKLLADSPEHAPKPSISFEDKLEQILDNWPPGYYSIFSKTVMFDWSVPSKTVMITNKDTESEREYLIFRDVTRSIDPAGQRSTAYPYYIISQNPDQEVPEELQNLIHSVDPVENAEAPKPQPARENLLRLINLGQNSRLMENPTIYIPNLPPRILHGATYQNAEHREGEEVIVILESPQGYQHNAIITVSNGLFILLRLTGQLPSGTPYELSAPEHLSEADKKRLGQLRQQRDKQEENNNHPESTDGSSDD